MPELQQMRLTRLLPAALTRYALMSAMPVRAGNARGRERRSKVWHGSRGRAATREPVKDAEYGDVAMKRAALKFLGQKLPRLRAAYILVRTLYTNFGLSIPKWVGMTSWFLRDYARYRRAAASSIFDSSARYLYPCLKDNRPDTPVDPVYFFQDTWAARKIFELTPEHHYDVGSSVMTVAILSQYVPVTMIDIRPIPLKLNGLSFRKGSILGLPFADASVASLSSLCVIEHIGLGRYGDDIDPMGSEKAFKELERVLQPGGNLFVSLPVDSECRVYFNAHRAFSRAYLLEMFDKLEIIEEKYQYGLHVRDAYDFGSGFGTGLFHLRKPVR